MLKRLTATKWGASQDVLITTYKSYVRPILEYGGEATITASNTTQEKLNVVQNNALRVITGGVKSTPIASMEAQTEIEPLPARRDKAALSFWERQKRVYGTKWQQYKPAVNRLKTQASPLTVHKALLGKYNLKMGEPAPLTEIPEVAHKLPKAEMQLINHHIPKHQSCEIALKRSTLETIAIRFPSFEWLHVYCDGSSMPGSGKTGAGYFSTMFEGAVAVGAPLSNYDGEIAAVLEAAKQLEDINPAQKVVFFVDCQAAIIALTTNSQTDCGRTQTCRHVLSCLQARGWIIVLQWVPSHVGVAGNERADNLAKEGTKLQQPVAKMTLDSAKSHIAATIKARIIADRVQNSIGKVWTQLVKKPLDRDLPRAVGVAAFRTLTGHDYLACHLHRIGVFSSPECPLCGHEKMDAGHLPHCPGLDLTGAPISEPHRTAHLYWSARRQMADMPRMGVG